MPEKAEIISECLPLVKSYCYCANESSTSRTISKMLMCRLPCFRYSLLPSVVKAHSKAQGVLSLAPFPKIYEVYTMLNGSTVYSLLDCTSGYHHIALSPKAEK